MKRIYKSTWAMFALALISVANAASASVVVSPSSVQVNLRGQVQFSATGSADGIVVWGVSGSGCSGITCGEITSDGIYTAPSTAPNPPKVTVMAVSLADPSQVGTASVAIGAPTSVSVAVSPTEVTLSIKGQQQFTAKVAGSSNQAVNWTVSGLGCVAGSCGTISSAGLYTAPATIPSPSLATVTATSVADPTKSSSATVVIQSASSVSVKVLPSTAQVATGGQQQFSATVTGSTNTSVRWTLSGTGCSGSTCGTVSSGGLYTAPASAPSPATVTLVATSVADPGQSARATISISTAPKLAISPTSPQIKAGGQIQFTASGSQSGVVVWSVSGGGCSGITCGSISSTGLYTAPKTAPNPNAVVVTATSLSTPSISGSTTVTIIAPVTVNVSISPNSAELNIAAKQQFTATVTGSSNTAVTWSVSGFGCAGAACGTITAGGLYTAPSQVPDPSFVTVTATSVADPTKSSSATVTVIQQIAVGISPVSAQVIESGTQQFTAKVTGTTVTGVTWSVSGTGCAGAACGTVNQNGLYVAPASVPNPAKVTVTATSVADTTVSASAAVTVIVPVIVTVSPKVTIIAVSTSEQFHATVTGTTNTTITWSVTGAGCSGATCGTISTAGLYTAPASIPNPATVTVKATSKANTSSSDSAAVTFVASNNSKLAGQYAFFFTGFDNNGVYQTAGSFTADGRGNITSGLEDVNNFARPSTNVAITGNYSVTSDNRGTMTVNSTLGAKTFRFSLNQLGTKGRFISFDQSGVRGSGVIERQDPNAFDPSVLANGYVLNLAGTDQAGARVGALGLIFPDGSGFVAGSTLDVNDGGSVSPTFGSFFGVYGVDSKGRGTITLNIPGFGGGSLNFAFYVVSASEFLLVDIDPIFQNGMIFGGEAELQNGAPFSPSSFNGPSIFSLNGTNGSSPQEMVGRFAFDGNENVAITFDQNNGGNVTVGGSMTGAYDLELNGRGTLNLTNPANGGSTIWYIYATGPNRGFVMDASTGAASTGEIIAEQVIPPFSNSDILGNYFFGPEEPITMAVPLFSGVDGFDGGSSVLGKGLVTGAQDSSQVAALNPGQTVAGTYTVSSVSNNGRGAILFTSPTAGMVAVWVASPTEMIGLNVDGSTPQPTILHFEQ